MTKVSGESGALRGDPRAGPCGASRGGRSGHRLPAPRRRNAGGIRATEHPSAERREAETRRATLLADRVVRARGAARDRSPGRLIRPGTGRTSSRRSRRSRRRGAAAGASLWRRQSPTTSSLASSSSRSSRASIAASASASLLCGDLGPVLRDPRLEHLSAQYSRSPDRRQVRLPAAPHKRRGRGGERGSPPLAGLYAELG